MKKTLSFCLLGLIAIGAFAANPKEKKNIKPNDPAIIYSLPKTVLVVEVEATKTVQKAGPYYNYSEHYLALKDVVTENKTTWEINKISIRPKTIADKNKTFILNSDPNLYVSLTKEGVICGINTPAPCCMKPAEKNNYVTKGAASDDDFFNNGVLTEEQLTANSTAKMAETAAKQIYRIRDSRLSLITGDNDKIPSDGESLKLMLKKLDQSEKSLVEMFAGKKIKTTVTKEIEITPDKALKNELLFRLSGLNGIVDKDDLSGSPVYITLTPSINDTPQAVTEKKENKFYYMLPGTAHVLISNSENKFLEDDFSIAQFGSIQALPAKVLKNKCVKIKYDPQTGSLISIEK